MLTLSDGERVYLGDAVISDIEIARHHDPMRMESRFLISAQIQRVIDRAKFKAREPGALAFRRVLSMGRE